MRSCRLPTSGPSPQRRRGPQNAAPRVRSSPAPLRARSSRGSAIGLAHHLGWPVRWIRLAFVLISIPTGAGLVAYVFLWALTPQSRGGVVGRGRRAVDPADADALATAGGGPRARHRRRRARRDAGAAGRRAAARHRPGRRRPERRAQRSPRHPRARCSSWRPARSSRGPSSTTPSAGGGSDRKRAQGDSASHGSPSVGCSRSPGWSSWRPAAGRFAAIWDSVLADARRPRRRRPDRRALGAAALVRPASRAGRAGPRHRARRHRRAPARLGAADPRAHPAQVRRPRMR